MLETIFRAWWQESIGISTHFAASRSYHVETETSERGSLNQNEPIMARRIVDGRVIKRRRSELGLVSPRALADISDVDLRTIVRCEKSPITPYRPNESTLKDLSKALAMPVSALVVSERENSDPQVRDCSGRWSLSGIDLEIPGFFQYPNGKMSVNAEVTMTVDGTDVMANGRDTDGDRVAMQGRLKEGGNQIIGTYEIENQRMRIYGTVVLEYLACGRRMRGFYLGREIGEGTTHILGQLNLELIGE